MNSLLLAKLTKNLEEVRKPVSLHSVVTKDIFILGNLNCVFRLKEKLVRVKGSKIVLNITE